jgi:hypothetical protein
MPDSLVGSRAGVDVPARQVPPQDQGGRVLQEAPMKMRKRYPGLAGKVVKYAESFEEDGKLYLGIHFTDGTQLSFVVAPQTPKIEVAQLLKWKGGTSTEARMYTS